MAGTLAFAVMGNEELAKAWLTALAVVHIGFGLAAPRLARVSHELGLLGLTLGILMANVAFGLVAGGVVLTLGWAASGVGFALLVRHTRRGGRDDVLAEAGLGGHLALALVHVLSVDAPPAELAAGGGVSAASAAATVALAAGCLVSGRLVGAGRPLTRIVLDALGLAALAYLTALALDGPTLALAWAAEAGALVLLARRTRDRVAGWAGLGFLALAGGHALAYDVPLRLLGQGLAPPLERLAVLGLIVAVAVAAARLLPELLLGEADAGSEAPRALSMALDVTGLLALTHLTALVFDGELLAVALAAEAALLGVLSRRFDDPPAGYAALALLSVALLHALVFEAPPVALVTGLEDPFAAIVALGSVAAAALTLSGRPLPIGVTACVLLYLASALVVTPFESSAAGDSALLSAHQQGQMVLSVFWGLVGVCTIVLGLRRDAHALRVAGLALLGVTVAKVFISDLAALSSIYRVVSFIGLGLLLLAGALVWQRLRLRTLSDLRETPGGVR